MNTVDFLGLLRTRNIILRLDGERLRINAPKDALTPELHQELARRKPELIMFLRGLTAPATAPSAVSIRSREGRLPLSPTQHRLWFIEQLEPGTGAYNLVLPIRLTGRLNEQAVQSACDALLARHETLRTTFPATEGVPYVSITPAGAARLTTITIPGETPAKREENAQEWLHRFARQSLSLAIGPLFLAALARLEEEQHILAFLIHHSICDGWSMGVLFNDWTESYVAATEGRSPALQELPYQYIDYAAWQSAQMDLPGGLPGETRRKAVFDHWKQQLDGCQPLSTFPAHRERPTHATYRGARTTWRLSADTRGAMEHLARELNASNYMVLMAALAALLHRYNQQDDVIVGTPTAGRQLPGSELLIGPLLNLLPIRVRLDGDPTFAELVRRVRDFSLDAFAHQEAPFEQLVETLRVPRDMGAHPLFQVMLAYQNFPTPRARLPGLDVGYVPVDRGASQFDLSLFIVEEGDGLSGTIEYSTDLYEDSMVAGLLAHLATLLQAGLASPETKVARLPLFAASQRQTIVDTINQTDVACPPQQTVVDLFQEQVQRRPKAVAVRHDRNSLTYAELDARSTQLARHLRRLGAGREILVGVCVERSLDMVVAVLGVLKSGAGYVPLDPGFPAERLRYMLQDCAAPLVVTQAGCGQVLLDGSACQLVALDADSETISRESIAPLTERAAESNCAYVLYTSGSTGRPKGVVIEHRALSNFLSSMAQVPGLTEQDVLLAITTLSFDISGLELFLPLITGARIELASRETCLDGHALAKLMSRSGATVMQATPATWRMLFDSGWKGNRTLKVLCGGEALNRDLAAKLVPAVSEVWNMYGPTETTIWSTVARITSPDDITIGCPIANTRTYVLDRHGEPQPIGVVGELWIGGDGVARGYLNRPELTAERFGTNPFHPGRMYRTGDLARLRPDGRLDCLGRIDAQIKVRGYRIELGEIESVLGEHPDISECAVVARDRAGDTRLVAYYAGTATVETLRRHLRDRLPDYMVPAHYVCLPALPHTPNQKIDRNRLPAPEVTGEDLRPVVAPRTLTERKLAAIFAEVLDIPAPSVSESFFDLGGHSLLATKLMAAIERDFGVRLPLARLFDAPSIEKLAGSLSANGPDATVSWSSLVPIAAKADRPVLFLVHGAGGNVLLYRELARRLSSELSIYGLQSQGLDWKSRPLTCIEDMARHYMREIRSIQPHGPYFIAGYCMGGAISYEIARLLDQEGEPIGMVGLLDTYNLAVVKRGAKGVIRPSFLMQKARFHLGSLVRMSPRHLCGYLGEKVRMAVEALVSVVRARFRRPVHSSTSDLAREGAMTLMRINHEAAWSFVPQPFHGPVTVFRPLKNYKVFSDPQMGWSHLVGSRLEIVELPLNPHAMLIEPWVAHLARELAKRIGKAPCDGANDVAQSDAQGLALASKTLPTP